MPKAYFIVRSVVAEPLRQKFDHWYSADHLPMALKEFKAEKAGGSGARRMRACITPSISLPIRRGSTRR